MPPHARECGEVLQFQTVMATAAAQLGRMDSATASFELSDVGQKCPSSNPERARAVASTVLCGRVATKLTPRSFLSYFELRLMKYRIVNSVRTTTPISPVLSRRPSAHLPVRLGAC
eukprot:scaffold91178_cov26-Tisochrysis_lutea.AAC.2